jgi:hypothetical protein
VSKIFPLIRQWKFYNKLCNLANYRTSLFFLQKKAFKTFLKETKQDVYSGKILLNKSFLIFYKKKNLLNINLISYYFHNIFYLKLGRNLKTFCIYCGVKI